jgi:hypothetical protein
MRYCLPLLIATLASTAAFAQDGETEYLKQQVELLQR